MNALVPLDKPDEIALMALAKAAARLALEERDKTQCDCLDEDAIEKISMKVCTDVFRSLGVDINSLQSVNEFRRTITSAEEQRTWIDKARSTIWTGFWGAIGAAVLALVLRYGIGGGVGK